VSRRAAFREVPKTVRVGVSPRLADKIDEVFLAIDRIADLSGHTACATGCDIFFELERSFVIDAKLDITEQGLVFG